MKLDLDREMLLEAGVVLFVVGLIFGGGVLLLGQGVGSVRHKKRKAIQAPAAGSISHQRHQNIGTVSAR